LGIEDPLKECQIGVPGVARAADNRTTCVDFREIRIASHDLFQSAIGKPFPRRNVHPKEKDDIIEPLRVFADKEPLDI
jgi:hypothetical protein